MSSNLSNNDNSDHSLKNILDSGKNGKPHGIQSIIHGILYQIKLSLHYGIFACSKTKNKKNFSITNEMPNGGILDDIVVATKDPNGTNTISLFFLQAKHSLDGRSISHSDITKDPSPLPKKDISLMSFFKSFKLIKADPIYSTYLLEKCYFCSNGPLSKTLKKMMLQVHDGNEFFLKESGELWKFNKQSPHISDLKKKLKKTTDFEMLLVKLLHCVIREKKRIEETNGIFSVYHVALMKEKILDRNKFNPDFIDNKGLSVNAKRFRKTFIERYMIAAESETIERAKEDLRKMWLPMSARFGKIPDVSPLNNFDADKFAKQLHELIKQNLKNADQIVYEKSQIGRFGRTGKNQIDLLAQFVFVYADNKKTIKFRKSFFDDDFVRIVDQLVVPDSLDVKRKLLEFKKCLWKYCLKDNSKVNTNILKQCRFKMGGIYSSVYETEQVTLPSNKETSDQVINDFLDNFYFAVNQPNEKRLSELIKEQLCKVYNLSDTSMVSSYLLEKAINWTKDSKRGAIDGEEIDQWLKDGKQETQNLGIYFQTRIFRRKLRSYGNDHKITNLKEFLNDQTKRILWLSTDDPMAIATLIPATLIATNKTKFRNVDSYILNSLSTLVYSQKEIILFYQNSSTSSDKPLIIVDEKNDEKDSVIEFAQNISQLVGNNDLKQLVIVGKDSSKFANRFKKQVIKKNVSFKDYNQNPLLKRIKFQGKMIKVKEVIKNDPDLLKELNTDDKIIIGQKFLPNKAAINEPATYIYGNVNVIEINNMKKMKEMLIDVKAKEMKDKFPSYWVATFNLKTILNKCGETISSLKELISCSIQNKLNRRIFEHLYDKKQIILIIDGSTIPKKDVQLANEMLMDWKYASKKIWIVMKKTISRQVVPMP